MLLYVFNTYRAGSRFPEIDTACLKPQLDAIDGYVSELKSAMEATPAPQRSSTQDTVGQSVLGTAQDCSAPLQCLCNLSTLSDSDQLCALLSMVCLQCLETLSVCVCVNDNVTLTYGLHCCHWCMNAAQEAGYVPAQTGQHCYTFII